MPQNTPRGYTYPLYSDLTSFPAQIQDFAQDVDVDVQTQVNTINTALTAPSARVSASANLNVPPSTFVFLTFATEEFDNAAIANLGVNNDRLTFTSTGIYLIECRANFASNGNALVGGREGQFIFSVGSQNPVHNVPGIQTMDSEWSMTYIHRATVVNEFVRCRVIQSSGAALNVTARSFSVTKVSV